jgi:NitT/TauT family transport system permease protein
VTLTLRRTTDWIPALGVLVAFLGLWEGVVKGLHIKRFLLPAPDAIFRALRDNQSALWHAGWFTFQEAVGGFAIGCGIAIVFAVVVARWDRLGGALMPYAIAANAVPIIAFAPITNAWFNPLDKGSKMAIAAVLCFFPVLITTLRGLTSVDPRAIELMRSYAANRRTVFRRVRIPASLPHMFAGLKIASVLSMIGAIVGEYFGGPTTALGVTILNASAYTNFPVAWAGIVLASAFGILFYSAVALAERLTTSWDPSRRDFHTE